MTPGIDGNASPCPSGCHGAGDDRDRSTTEAIMAERMAEDERRKRDKSMRIIFEIIDGLSRSYVARH